jgi:hypothetical protein
MRSILVSMLLAASSALAAPFAVQLGDARVALDAPPGFADTQFTGSPRLQEIGESLTSASNRVLLFALSDADLRRFMQGDQLELRRYMIAVTPRAMERERLSEGAFKSLVGNVRGDVTDLPTGDFQKHLDSRAPGTVVMLAELRKEADAVSVLQGSRSKSGLFERTRYLLTSNSLVLLRGKALTLSVYTQYDDPADLEWIRATTNRWIDDLKRLNSR